MHMMDVVRCDTGKRSYFFWRRLRAAEGGHAVCVRLLLSAGADIEVKEQVCEGCCTIAVLWLWCEFDVVFMVTFFRIDL